MPPKKKTQYKSKLTAIKKLYKRKKSTLESLFQHLKTRIHGQEHLLVKNVLLLEKENNNTTHVYDFLNLMIRVLY